MAQRAISGCLCSLSVLIAGAASAQSTGTTLLDLDLEALLRIDIVSASNSVERLSDAPATVIVLTRDDIRNRGYTELSSVLNDLPGMQVIRPYGDTYVKNYWRGYRGFKGDTYLVMVDGLTQQHLWYNEVETPWVVLPLSNVERIEVVYGPASAVYGANAMMGVVNIITTADKADDGPSLDSTLQLGEGGAALFDGSYRYTKGRIRLALTARVDDRDSVSSNNNDYYYTQDRLYTDQRIWGDFAEGSGFSGSHPSHTKARAFDARLFIGNTEFGLLSYQLDSGTGNEYAADAAQRGHRWVRRELSAHVRHRQSFGEHLTGTSLIRWRESGNPNSSYFIERVGTTVDFSYYQTQSHSATVQQDFDYRPQGRFSANFGFRYERKDLQKGYDNPYGDFVTAPDLVDLDGYRFPTRPDTTLDRENRIITTDRALYAQGKWRLGERHIVVLGGRFDSNSVFGDSPTLRLGYVGNYGAWGLKVLHGEGFQEPSQRLLYGYWAAGQSNAQLDPETSETNEISLSYGADRFSAILSNWWVRNTGITVPSSPFALNLGSSEIVGSDLHLRFRTSGRHGTWDAWSYLSYLHSFTGENSANEQGDLQQDGLTADGHVGDLARWQAMAGISYSSDRYPVTVTLLGRHVGPRTTVASNPVDQVEGYQTYDLTLRLREPAGLTGWELGLTVNNLTNTRYFHPGVSSANAGITPGGFDSNQVWRGSQGFYSSLLAQPGRSIQMVARFGF